MRAILIGLSAMLTTLAPAGADLAPRPPPPGPSEADVAGVSIGRVRIGRRAPWQTTIRGCNEARQPVCKGRRLVGCRIEAVNGTQVPGGDIAALLAAVATVNEGPLRLQLSGEGVSSAEAKADGAYPIKGAPCGELVLRR